jgi:hypothetical protein
VPNVELSVEELVALKDSLRADLAGASPSDPSLVAKQALLERLSRILTWGCGYHLWPRNLHS